MPRSHEVSTTLAVAGGSYDCRLSIADFRLAASDKPIGNRKSKIENHETHPLPGGWY